ncbi:substrate-binding domain-containing protein [Litoribrevibacter euphylliae]|uniref:Substrate-binding domain-containing protein n=1 Tax=Litoribrevibacter euphylliae TaxID=1834034 RepID=A0ABV7HJG1_9GAMM
MISSSVLADLHLKEYWMVDEFFKANPEQLERSEAFNLRVQSQPKRLINNTDSARILVIYPGLQTSDYWRRSIHAFEHRLKQLGIRYQLDVHFTKPGSDLNLQAKLLTQSLGDTTDYLVFTLDAIKHQKLIEQVKHQTQTKIILQNITTPLRAFSKQQPFLYVGFDHAIGTQLLVQEYQTRFPQGANYGILFGTQGYVSKIRGGLFESQMRAAHNFHLKDSYYVDFDRAKAKAATLQLIKDHHQPDASADTNAGTHTNKLDFIYATSTDIALGALDALKELGLEQDIQINGWGGGSSELNSLKAKELSFTVMRMNDDNGVAMAEAIGLDLLGKSDQVPTIYSGSFRLVDQTIKPKQLNRFESRAFRYSNLSSETH